MNKVNKVSSSSPNIRFENIIRKYEKWFQTNPNISDYIELFKKEYSKFKKSLNIELNVNELRIKYDNKHKVTPLTWAIINNSLPLVKLLIEVCKAEVDVIPIQNNDKYVSSCNRQSSLYMAITNDYYTVSQRIDLMKYLIDANCDIHLGDSDDTCLKYCVRKNQLNELLDYIMSKENLQSYIYKKDIKGRTIANYIVMGNFFKEYNFDTITNILKGGYYLGMFTDLAHQIFTDKNVMPHTKNADRYLGPFLKILKGVKPVNMSAMDKLSLINAMEIASILINKEENVTMCNELIKGLGGTPPILPANDINFQYHDRLVQILGKEEDPKDKDKDIWTHRLFVCERACLSSTEYKYSSIFMHFLIKVFQSTSKIELMFLGLQICIQQKYFEHFANLLFIIYTETRDRETKDKEDKRTMLLKTMTTSYMDIVSQNMMVIDTRQYDFIVYIYVLLLLEIMPKDDKMNIHRIIKHFRLPNGNSILHYLINGSWLLRDNDYIYDALENRIGNDQIMSLFNFLANDCEINLKTILNNQNFDLYSYALIQDRTDIKEMLTKDYGFRETLKPKYNFVTYY